MDAANPLLRHLRAAALAPLLAAGCASSSPAVAAAPSVARPQAPADPLAPVAPLRPPAQPTIQPTSLSRPQTAAPSVDPGAVKAANLAEGAKPRVKVVALVGTTNVVTDAEVWEAVRQRPEMQVIGQTTGPDRDAKEQELYRIELRHIIERELVLDDMFTRLKKVGKAGMLDEIKEFAGKSVERNLRDYRKRLNAKSEEEFQFVLQVQGLTYPVIRRQLERQVMMEEYVRSMLKDKGPKIGLAEVREYYEAHPDEFKTADRAKWMHLWVSLDRFATRAEAYAYCDAIQQNAAAGHDFLDLVKRYDHSRPAGAHTDGLGVGQKRGEIQPADLEPHVWALSAGQVSRLIETPTGFHILKVVERDVAGVKPFDTAVQGQIREKLTRKMREVETQKLVDDLWRKGVVRVIEQPN